MKHSVRELYRVEGSNKVITKEAAELIANIKKVHSVISIMHKTDEVKIIDINGTKSIYMFGEKTWFDTQEELNEHREEYHRQQNALKERRRILNAIIGELDTLSTEELQTILDKIKRAQ